MTKSLKAIRGTKDTLPAEAPYWHRVESLCREIMASYAYEEIRTPVLEETALFARSIGDETDIVSKEMYSFEDRSGDHLSLRPEGTACVVRAGIQAGLFHNQWQRLWYMGPMFRHERPQRGRYRQFHQVGVEAYGYSGVAIEAEVISLSYRLLKSMGLADDISCQINHLGSASERAGYRDALVAYLTPHKADLDSDSQRRLGSNPLRILDSKVPSTREILQNAPLLTDYLSQESRDHLAALQEALLALGVTTELNPGLVRGLDYYTGIVFEWVTDSLGAQGTVCAGGRYDGLVESLGGRSTPAFGFAAGLERLILMLQEKQQLEVPIDICVLPADDSQNVAVLQCADALRDAFPEKHVSTQLAGRSLKATLKSVLQTTAAHACVVHAKDRIECKHLKTRESQDCSTHADVVSFLERSK